MNENRGSLVKGVYRVYYKGYYTGTIIWGPY